MVKFLLCKFYHQKRRLEKQKALHRRPKKSTKTLEEVAWELCLKGWKDLGGMAHSKWGGNVSEGPAGKRTRMAQGRCSQCGSPLLGRLGTTGRGPGSATASSRTAKPSRRPLLLTPTPSHFWIDATSEVIAVSSLFTHTHVLLLGNPFCLMKSIPSRWASPSLQSLPGLQNSPTLPISLLHKNPHSSKVGLRALSYSQALSPCLMCCWCSVNTCGAEESCRSSNSRSETCTNTGEDREDGNMNVVEEREVQKQERRRGWQAKRLSSGSKLKKFTHTSFSRLLSFQCIRAPFLCFLL